MFIGTTIISQGLSVNPAWQFIPPSKIIFLMVLEAVSKMHLASNGCVAQHSGMTHRSLLLEARLHAKPDSASILFFKGASDSV